MKLRGQLLNPWSFPRNCFAGPQRPAPHRRRSEQGGYAMAALLVSLGVMAILMTMALPVWKQSAQREREAELVFRGEQYAHAIGLFQRKFAGAFPPNVDVLIEQRFLRKEYKDPMVPDGKFQILYQTTVAPTGVPGRETRDDLGRSASQAGQSIPRVQGQPATPTGSSGTLGPRGGVTGVTSKSKQTSIRLYKGRSRYDEWVFVYTAVSQQPVAPSAPGGTRPGQPPPAPGNRATQPEPFRLNPPTPNPPAPGGGFRPIR